MRTLVARREHGLCAKEELEVLDEHFEAAKHVGALAQADQEHMTLQELEEAPTAVNRLREASEKIIAFELDHRGARYSDRHSSPRGPHQNVPNRIRRNSKARVRRKLP